MVRQQVQEGEARGEARGEAKGKLEERITGLHTLLRPNLPGSVLEQIEANWRRAGQGRTLAEMVEVGSGRADWRSLLLP